MTLTPNTQNTPSEILGQMREEKPFYLSERVNIYVIEAMKLYATEKVKEALRVAAAKACDALELYPSEYEKLEQAIISLETELVELINK